MRKTLTFFPLVIGLVLLISAGFAFGSQDFKVKSTTFAPDKSEYAAGEILVKFKVGVGVDQINRIHARHGTSEMYTSPLGGFKRIRIPSAAAVDEMVELFRGKPEVEYAEPNYIFNAFMTPNDEYYSYQWHMPMINMETAWDQSTGTGVVVAVIDCGVAYEDYGAFAQAPDLAGTAFVAGYDFVNSDTHPNDDNGHGTHVAGTVAQTTNNSIGVTGVAFDCSIMPVKVLDGNGSGYLSDVADGIIWAADNGANVINLSLGSSSSTTTLQDAVQYAYGKGVTLVCAAGNANSPVLQYPASYVECISVSAVRLDSARAPYSSYGSEVDICAPGGDVDVDQNNDSYGDGVLQQTHNGTDYKTFAYYFYEGTSMASPHVAGVAALLVAKDGTLTPQQVRDAIEGTAVDLGTAGWDKYFGYGLVDADAAIQSLTGSAPVADFSGSPTTGDAPLTVNFTDLSTNNPTSWSWTFGDGGTSTVQNPSYTYNTAGTYNVALTATNDYGSGSTTKTGYITVNEPQVQGTMHVHDIVVTRKTAGPNCSGIGTIYVYDVNNQPVEDATVEATATGPVGATFSGATDADGIVVFKTGKTRTGCDGEWCYEVTNVTHASNTYDAAANVVTKACESGPVAKAGGDITDLMPNACGLQNHPNPFNPTTEISFGLPTASRVTLEVYNIVGQKVATLVEGYLEAGPHSVTWDASQFSSGVYLYRLQADEMVETRKMVLMK
jgi:serine protease